jgi:hypothetical protein
MAYAWMDQRFARAPENDDGAEFDEVEEGLDAEGLEDDALDGDDDEGEGDAAGAEEGDGEEASSRATHDEQVRQPTRGERRIAQLAKETRDAKAEVARLKALVERPVQQQPQETPAQRAERLAMMEPEDRINFLVDEKVGGLQRQFATLSFQMQDTGDRTAFDSLCARNPVAAKLKDQVEARLGEMRAAGTTAPRETVLKYVIGDRALANAARAGTKVRKAAATNIQRQTARSGSARGDAADTSRRAGADTPEARRKRLEGVQI